jgi:hypothetical protein
MTTTSHAVVGSIMQWRGVRKNHDVSALAKQTVFRLKDALGLYIEMDLYK